MLRDGVAFTRPSRRFGVLVYLSVLLLLLTSTAQAAHHHGSWTGNAETRSATTRHSLEANVSDSAELTCPLCMVSHSAVPVFPALIARLDLCAGILLFVFQTAEPAGFWSYNLFSRPPPAS